MEPVGPLGLSSLQICSAAVFGCCTLVNFKFANFKFEICLPPVMRKSLVRFRHAVNVFLLLDCRAAVVGGVKQFVAELVGHPLFATATRIADQPPDRE